MDAKAALHDVSEQQLPVTETTALSESPTSTQESKRRFPPPAKAWIILLFHGACCVALALAMALALDGYQAGDESSPHHVEGKLLLRVGDITTLVSVALVVIKVIVGAWSTIVLWAFGRNMLTRKSASPATVSKMIRWRLPPGFQSLKYIPRDFPGWTISAAVVAVFIQAFISPILTGAVNWNAAFHISKEATSLSSVDPTADFSAWYWYNAQGSFDKKAYLRAAAGFANLAWADTSTVDAQGKSLLGNGCRHVVNDDGLPRHSVVVDATLPCININSIRWYRNEDEVTGNEWSISGDDLTLVGDDPFGYYRGGVTLVYDTNNLRKSPATTDQPPPANKFSGTMTVALMIARRHYGKDYTDPPCAKLPNTIFGDISPLPYLLETTRSTSADENCFLLGKIDFTAGVTTSSRATYIAPRIVEDVTPIQDVVYEANSWTQEAIWLLPDLMTMLAVSNASQLPTFNNIDNYVSGIVHQGYLGAWDMLSHSFDNKGPVYKGYPADPRLVADVSFARVFAWLGVCLFMTVSGVFALGLVLKADDLTPLEGNEEEMKEGGRGILDEIMGWRFG
ncbi:uncharacterized protein BDZ99DRAFT_461581 [Mytilinidion resinicola]|uniref:Uncharacterized protein n=1 Tax=Mytilinidion resinicola TaxID=574789 RepID=A0A6A6YUA3_9PEZI|nr:uncharacterized protein BDZ99DRAFT_461581 [Mytilinidion resinicola]KAF2811545.1 hypothetical protein BDZ99DRAFT_461581 [Mytilinidion resinicola]